MKQRKNNQNELNRTPKSTPDSEKPLKSTPPSHDYQTFRRFSILGFVLTIVLSAIYIFFIQVDDRDVKLRLASIGVVSFVAGLHIVFSIYSIGEEFPIFPSYVYYYMQTAVFIQVFLYLRGYLQNSEWVRILITYPFAIFQMVSFIATVLKSTVHRINKKWFSISLIFAVAFTLSFVGVYTSLVNPENEQLTLRVGDGKNTLKIIQMTDVKCC